MVAFANSNGGTLLIGVKDNGNIVGINSDEEFYMVQAAAQMYCRPQLHFEVMRWEVEGKTILEVEIEAAKRKPYRAPDKNGRYRAYIRVADKNVPASPIQVKIWKLQQNHNALQMPLGNVVSQLFTHLQQHKRITVKEFSQMAFLPTRDAENTLINLAALHLIRFHHTQNEEYFSLIKN